MNQTLYIEHFKSILNKFIGLIFVQFLCKINFDQICLQVHFKITDKKRQKIYEEKDIYIYIYSYNAIRPGNFFQCKNMLRHIYCQNIGGMQMINIRS